MNDPDPNEALEQQQLLVESTLPLVFESYDNAIEDQISDPIVLIVDCEDELGGQIARGWLGDETIDDAIAAQAEEELTTVVGRAIAWEVAIEDLVEAFPYLEPAFEDGPPEDGVLVISVTAGGASALTAPWDARS